MNTLEKVQSFTSQINYSKNCQNMHQNSLTVSPGSTFEQDRSSAPGDLIQQNNKENVKIIHRYFFRKCYI